MNIKRILATVTITLSVCCTEMFAQTPQPSAPSDLRFLSLIESMVQVKVNSGHFFVSKYEVTEALWDFIMGEGKSDSQYPKTGISWEDCNQFLKKLNASSEAKSYDITFRLPTNDEWEYACRAGSEGYFGNLANGNEGSLEYMGWYSGNSRGEAHEVGKKLPNALGLYDMHGNVWEWTSSRFVEWGDDIIVRGGCFRSGESDCAISNSRRIMFPLDKDFKTGCRLAMEAPPDMIEYLKTQKAALEEKDRFQKKVRQMEEAKKAKAEEERKKAEEERKKAEEERKKAEEERKKAEEEARRLLEITMVGNRLSALSKDNAVAGILQKLNSDMVIIPGKELRMCKVEVTQILYEKIMGYNPSVFIGDTLPVDNVSLLECQVFVNILNSHPTVKESGLTYRLPTADEWEFACKTGVQPNDEDIGASAWIIDNSDQSSHSVGAKKANAHGIFDMQGNVWEWTSTQSGKYYILKGGSWALPAFYCQPQSVSEHYSTDKSKYFGFRLVAD